VFGLLFITSDEIHCKICIHISLELLMCTAPRNIRIDDLPLFIRRNIINLLM